MGRCGQTDLLSSCFTSNTAVSLDLRNGPESFSHNYKQLQIFTWAFCWDVTSCLSQPARGLLLEKPAPLVHVTTYSSPGGLLKNLSKSHFRYFLNYFLDSFETTGSVMLSVQHIRQENQFITGAWRMITACTYRRSRKLPP